MDQLDEVKFVFLGRKEGESSSSSMHRYGSNIQ